MAYINIAPTAELETTYNSLVKYVKQYITNGNLKSKFDVFEREAVEQGGGVETNIILATKNVRATEGTERAPEHGTYTAKVVTIISTGRKPAQYPVTVDMDRLALCVNNEAALKRYAAELTESLYQGWTDDKNAGVATALNALITAVGENAVSVDIGGGGQAYADKLLTAMKATAEDLREGVLGQSYGNNDIGDSRIAADSIVMIMSNATAAMLDTYGFAKAFNDEYLKTNDVFRVTSNRIAENIIIITDSRNIILHKRNENLTEIANSDGSHNIFYNVNYFLDTATGTDSTTSTDYVGYPIKILKGVESDPGLEV